MTAHKPEGETAAEWAKRVRAEMQALEHPYMFEHTWVLNVETNVACCVNCDSIYSGGRWPPIAWGCSVGSSHARSAVGLPAVPVLLP